MIIAYCYFGLDIIANRDIVAPIKSGAAMGQVKELADANKRLSHYNAHHKQPISLELYYTLLAVETALWIDKGMDLMAARELAREKMDSAFVVQPAAIQCEYEADYADYIEEMSIGGPTYRVPR